MDDQRWPELLRVAATYGIAPRRHDALEFAQRSRVLLLQHTSGVRLDVSCGALPFELDLVEQAETFVIGATTVRVARPDRLIVIKAVANRPKDWADIEALLEAHPTVAFERIRLVVAEFADALGLPEILSRFDDVAGRHRSKGRTVGVRGPRAVRVQRRRAQPTPCHRRETRRSAPGRGFAWIRGPALWHRLCSA